MVDAPTLKTLSGLIGAIYDCVLEPSRWEQVLSDIKDVLDCRTATLSLLDLDNNHALFSRSVGLEPAVFEELAIHGPEVIAVLTGALATWPSIDEPHLMSRHIPEEYLAASPYVQTCLKPHGIVDIMQYFLINTPSRVGGWGMARDEQQGIITARELELGGLLLPHVRRAVTISDVLELRTIERDRATEALNALNCAVVMIDRTRMIVHANRSGEALLRAGDLVRDQSGVLEARDAAAAAELHDAIELACENEALIGKSGLAIRLTRPDQPPVLAHVLPMNGSDLRQRLQPRAAAAVFIGPTFGEDRAASAIAMAYGLTRSETRVVASLLGGCSLAATATALGIAASTAKTHLDNIFYKTGVSRQADLIRLGAQIVPPTRS